MASATHTALREENDRLRQQVNQLQTVLNTITTGVALLEPLIDQHGQLTE
jgi:hypothetical protein